MAGILVLGFIKQIDLEDEISESEVATSEYLLSALENNPKEITTTGTIELSYSAKKDIWTLTEMPEIYMICGNCYENMNPVLGLPEAELKQCMVVAGYRMLSDGEIDSNAYEFLFYAYGEHAEEPVDSLQNDIEFSVWFDVTTGSDTEYYIVGSTSIMYVVVLFEEHPGVVFEYEFYKDDPSNIIESGGKIFTDQQEQNMIYFRTDVPEGLVKGIYGVTISLTDGSVLLQEEFEVK